MDILSHIRRNRQIIHIIANGDALVAFVDHFFDSDSLDSVSGGFLPCLVEYPQLLLAVLFIVFVFLAAAAGPGVIVVVGLVDDLFGFIL